MFKLETVEVVKKQIANVGKSGARLAAAIQTAAMQVLAHAVKHGDITLAQSLVNSVPKHSKAALVAWLEVYGPFAWDKDTKALKFFKANKQLKDAGIKVTEGDVTEEYMAALPKWESTKKPTEPRSQYDVSEEADRFLTRMRKLVADGNVEVQHKELLKDLMAAYNRYSARLTLGDAADNADVSTEGFVRTQYGDCPVIPGTTNPDPVQFDALKLAYTNVIGTGTNG